tara:strand:- start:677 stop:1258 length:582 start_codon:yes stop_codon:yes gene_type:complete
MRCLLIVLLLFIGCDEDSPTGPIHGCVDLWGTCYDISTTIELSLNNLTGTIPPEIGNLVNLSLLSLRGELTGTIPPEIGSLLHLNELRIQYTNLTGSIPDTYQSLDDLSIIDFSNNQLSGEIPFMPFGGMMDLSYIDLSDNQFSGTLSIGFCYHNNINVVDVHGNNLCPPYLECDSDQALILYGSQDTSDCPE